MKDQIVLRLLEQGHITVSMADSLLNNLLEKTSIITQLREDGIISTQETITLLKEEDHVTFPQIPTMPYKPYQPDWTYDPYRPGQPWWTVTSSHDPTSEQFEYSDTKQRTDNKE